MARARRGRGRSKKEIIETGTAEGYVGLVYEKPTRKDTMYSIKLEDDETWYRCGSKRPDVAEGEYISFDWELSVNGEYDNYDVVMKSIEVLEEAESYEEEEEEAPRSKSRGKASGGSKKAGTGEPTLKDMRISRQAARNSAIELTKELLAHGALVLPPKNKVADRQTALLGFVENLTLEYFFDTIALTSEDYLEALEYVEARAVDGDDYYEDEEVEEEEYEEEEEAEEEEYEDD